MKNTRTLINSYNITNVPNWVKNYLDGKRDINKNISMYLEEYLGLPNGTIWIYEMEYQKWINEII